MKKALIYGSSFLISLTLLSACATPPHVAYNGSAMASVKTIAVAVPAPTTYFAVSAGGPLFIPIPGASLVAAAVSGAVAGTASRASTRGNQEFNDVVREKLGDTGANRKFVDALEGVLREQGYTVTEIQLGQAGNPELKADPKLGSVLEGSPYQGADAILVASVLTGYVAQGPAQPYLRMAKAQIRIYRADTLKGVFGDTLLNKTESAFQQGGIPYSYNWYSALKEDLPHAIQGVDEALMGLVPRFKDDLVASRSANGSTASSGAVTLK